MKLLLRNSFLFVFIAVITVGCSCSSDKADETPVSQPEPDVFAYGYKLNDLEVVRDTVQKGDTFADILLENGFSNADIYNINKKGKFKVIAEVGKGAADHEVILDKNLIIIPVMAEGKVVALKVK